MTEELTDYQDEIDNLVNEIRKGIDGLIKVKSNQEKQNVNTLIHLDSSIFILYPVLISSKPYRKLLYWNLDWVD